MRSTELRTDGRRPVPSRRARLALGLGLICLLASLVPARQDPDEPAILDTGLIERTGVSLILLDVEVRDRQGRPMRGLGKSDFRVKLNGKLWEIYSVDDLCACEQDTPDAGLLVDADAEPGKATEAPDAPSPGLPLPAIAEPMSYVLYLDLSQLQEFGREEAFTLSRKWVLEDKRPDDRAMIVTYTSRMGVRTQCPLTNDNQVLVEALDTARADKTLFDPFPMGLAIRRRVCDTCCLTRCPGLPCSRCVHCKPDCLLSGARAEFTHGKYSLRALQRVLAGVEKIPGRKTMLMFHENSSIFPARYYPVVEFRVGDHTLQLDRVGAEANLARTSIYPIYTGGLQGETAGLLGEAKASFVNRNAIGFGANLADFTGGDYNRGRADIDQVMSEAGRKCACTYRLGLESPSGSSGTVYRARVEVHDRPVPHSYRVTYLKDEDRWLRNARAVLEDPSASSEIPVAAAVVPVGSGKGGGWEATVQVALNPSSLTQLPEGARTSANWEVGALLIHLDSKRSWEMLGASMLMREGQSGASMAILHERKLEKLPPGGYELRAFIRDRLANFYGGAEARIVLPRSGREALSDPVLLRAETRHLKTSLPMRRKDGKAPTTRSGEARSGRLPFASRAILAGEPVEFQSWVCFGKDREAIYDVQRYVSLEGHPIFRFEMPEMTRAGDCASFVDRLDTTPMEDGDYTYHVTWQDSRNETVSSEVEFDVTRLGDFEDLDSAEPEHDDSQGP